MSLTTSLSASQTTSLMASPRVVPRKRTGSDYIQPASQHSDIAAVSGAAANGDDDDEENAAPIAGGRASRRGSGRTASRGEPMQHRSQPQELEADSSVASSSGAATPNGKHASRRSNHGSSHTAATPESERKRRRLNGDHAHGSIDAADEEEEEDDEEQQPGSAADPDEEEESMVEQKPIIKAELGVNGHTGAEHPDRDVDG